MSHTPKWPKPTAALAALAEKHAKRAAKKTPKKPRIEDDAQPPTARKERRLREKNLTEAEVAVVRALQLLGEKRGKRIDNGELRAIIMIMMKEKAHRNRDSFIIFRHRDPYREAKSGIFGGFQWQTWKNSMFSLFSFSASYLQGKSFGGLYSPVFSRSFAYR